MTTTDRNMLDALMQQEFDPIPNRKTDPPDGTVYQRHIQGRGIVQVTAWLADPGGGVPYELAALDDSATRRFHMNISPGTPGPIVTSAVRATVDYVRNLPGGSWSD
jgi:hypothetical protein